MLKVLYLPINDHSNVQHGMYDAWRSAGTNMQVYDFYLRFLDTKNKNTVCNEFLHAVDAFQPDLIHMQLQMTNIIDSGTLIKARQFCKNKKVILTNWSGDVRNQASSEIVSVSGVVDYTLISSTGQIPLYEKAGCRNVKYWQIGYNPKMHYPRNYKNFDYDVSFIGNAYPHGTFADCGLRLNIISALRRRFGPRFGLFGAGYPQGQFGPTRSVGPTEVNEMYNKSRCALSVSNYNDISHYFSDRLLTCLASGRPTISYRFPAYESYFAHNSDILISHSIDETISLVEYCINNPDKATEIGYLGHRKALSEHTYTSRVIELLSMLQLSV